MPLTDQEQRCVDFACRYLEQNYGGSWSIKQYLDDQNPSEPTPEVILSNGEKTAAVEVKRLTGDSTQQEYLAALLSNNKYLVPSCGGHYYLSPPLGYRLPMEPHLRREVKEEIERVAPSLDPGQTGAIRIRREGQVSLISESGPPSISCLHSGPFSELMLSLKEKITGSYMIIDEGLEHSFVTEECSNEFEDAVSRACKNRLEGENAPFSWEEEWELIKTEIEDEDRDGVWVIAVTDARLMLESVEECVHAVLEKAMQKFRKRRWADLQIVVLETSVSVPARLAAPAEETFNPSDKYLVDHILLVEGEDVNEAGDLVSEQTREAEAAVERRLKHIIDSPISVTRVQAFQEEYTKCRWDIGATERIFRHSGAFAHRDQRNDSASFGISGLLNKGPFVDDSNWAALKGWEFAVASERRLLMNLGAHFAESVSQTGQILPDVVSRQPVEILDAAKSLSGCLTDSGFTENLIVIAAQLDTESMIALHEAMTVPGWELGEDLRTNWIYGIHENSIVLHMGNSELNMVFVVDLSKFASLVQFDPLVDLRVLAIESKAATEIAKARPELSLDMLRSMVQFHLYQSYDIEVVELQAIWAAKFSA